MNFLLENTAFNRRRLVSFLLFLCLSTFCLEVGSFSPPVSLHFGNPKCSNVVLQQTAESSHQNDHQQSSQQPPLSTKTIKDNISYTLQVSYQGRSCETQIRPGESILAALERTGSADALSIPSLPSDCRRGNCLTCVGKLHHSSQSSSNSTTSRLLVRGDDGLSPHMSREAQQRGYILTCSSYITGGGVHLELGANEQAWNDLYCSRLQDESAQSIGRAAVAKTIRLNAEQYPDEWKKETEEILRKTTSSSD